jgi:hypothetical protein
MGFFDIFKRKPPIRDSAALAELIDANAAFVTQKGIYEYARARAGHYAKVLFSEKSFHEVAEQARWRAYPIGLAMVAEVADNVLHRGRDVERLRGLQKLREIVLDVFDRYPSPAALDSQEWRDLRAGLVRRLDQLSLHPPKRAIDIPETYIQSYFDAMPIHEKLKKTDFHTTHNYLKVVLCNVHQDLENRIDLPALEREQTMAAAK